MIFASLIAKLGFDISGWTTNTKRATTDLKNLETNASATLNSLKSRVNSGAQLGKLLMGGGAVGGIMMAVKEIGELADAWLGVSKAAEAAAQAQKDVIAAANSAHAGEKEGKAFAASLDKQLRKSQAKLEESIATTPEEAFRIRTAEHNAELDDQLKDYKDKIDSLRDDAAQADKEIGQYTANLHEAQRAKKNSQIGHGGDAHVGDAVTEAVMGNYRKMEEEAQKGIDEATRKKVEASQKAIGLESQYAAIRQKIEEQKRLDENVARGDFLNDLVKADEARLKAQQDAADKAVEIEKEKQRKIKEEAIASLEEQRDALKEQIQGLSQKPATVNVDQIRGDAGIVIQPPRDPNTEILRTSRDHLKAIEQAMKDFKNNKVDLSKPVNVASF